MTSKMVELRRKFLCAFGRRCYYMGKRVRYLCEDLVWFGLLLWAENVSSKESRKEIVK